tara:strand:- start:218 stop:616 length:399 start_codon:yes stop_codon:yes gene_type:complete
MTLTPDTSALEHISRIGGGLFSMAQNISRTPALKERWNLKEHGPEKYDVEGAALFTWTVADKKALHRIQADGLDVSVEVSHYGHGTPVFAQGNMEELTRRSAIVQQICDRVKSDVTCLYYGQELPEFTIPEA